MTTTAETTGAAGTSNANPETPGSAYSGPELVIEAPKGWVGLNWPELYRYRELLYFMVWRDVTVRYKQTVLGWAWAVVQPTFQMVVFTVIFGRLAQLDSEGYPYAVFVFVGLLPWTFFSQGISAGGMSLINSQNLLTKVYFPRLFVPAAPIATCFVDFCIGLLICAGLLAFYQTMPSWQAVFVPLLLTGVIAATLGLGYILAALTVQFRDLRFVLPFLVQVMMYLSPVIYPVSMVPEKWQWLLALNPMAGLIDGFRSAILGKEWNFVTLGVSCLSAVVLLVIGLFVFRRTEQKFADIA